MQQSAHLKSFGRRLHNSLVALAASAGLLVAGLVAMVPQQTQLPASGPDRAAIGIEQAGLADAVAIAPAVGGLALPAAAAFEAQALEAESPKPRKQKPRRSRQTLATPYFSFATRS